MNGSKFMSLFKLFANKKTKKRVVLYIFLPANDSLAMEHRQPVSSQKVNLFLIGFQENSCFALWMFSFSKMIPSNLYFFEHFDNTIKLAIIFRSVFRTDKIWLILFLLFLAIKILFQFEIIRNEEKYQKENKMGCSKQNHKKWIDFVRLAIYLFVADILVVRKVINEDFENEKKLFNSNDIEGNV